MAFPRPCCPQKLPAATDPQTVTALAMTPLPSSYRTGTRKLGRVGHTGFKPPGNFLLLEKFLLSRPSLWLICTVGGMSKNPTCNALECWESSLATAPQLSLHKHCCTYFQLPTDLGWRAETKVSFSWGQEMFEASRWIPFFLSKCIPVVLTVLKSHLWLSSIWIRFCSSSPFIFKESLHALAHQLNEF